MERKSTVTSATYKRSYQGKMGTLYVHLITMENGDEGEYSSKSMTQEKFIPGKEVPYEYTESQREHNGKTYTDKKIAPVKTNFIPGKGGELNPEEQERIMRMNKYHASAIMVPVLKWDKKEFSDAYDAMYKAFCNDKSSRMAFMNIVNTQVEKVKFITIPDNYSVKDFVAATTAGFNYVIGIKA